MYPPMVGNVDTGRPPRRGHGRRKDRGEAHQRGAALVEFAFVAPMLMILLFGVIEFSWTFNQILDVRHGSREGARLVAVNYQPSSSTGAAQTNALIDEICTRVDEPGEVRVTISLVTAGANDPGDLAIVRVERDLEQLTGFFTMFLGNMEPASETTFLLEQEAGWSADVGEVACV